MIITLMNITYAMVIDYLMIRIFSFTYDYFHYPFYPITFFMLSYDWYYHFYSNINNIIIFSPLDKTNKISETPDLVSR